MGKKQFNLAYRLKSLNKGCEGRNMESGTKAEVMEKYCLLAYSACFLFMYFIIIFNLKVSSQYIGLAVLELGGLSTCLPTEC